MAVPVRAASGEKFSRRAAAAAGEYQIGVRNPRADWQQATLAAKERHKAAVTDSLAKDAWSKGVQRSSSAYQQEQAATLGPARFEQGVQAAGGRYEEGVAPYIQTIQSTTLPPKYPKGDPRNMERAKAMAAALHAKKQSMRG